MFLTICGFVARTFRSTSASISYDSVRCHFMIQNFEFIRGIII